MADIGVKKVGKPFGLLLVLGYGSKGEKDTDFCFDTDFLMQYPCCYIKNRLKFPLVLSKLGDS